MSAICGARGCHYPAMATSQRQRVPGSRRVLRRLHRRRRAPSRCTSSPSAALPWLACARTPGAGTEPFSSMRPHMTCTIPRQSAATRKRTSAVSAGCTRVAASPCWLPPEHRCKITLYVCTCIDVPCDTHDTSADSARVNERGLPAQPSTSVFARRNSARAPSISPRCDAKGRLRESGGSARTRM